MCLREEADEWQGREIKSYVTPSGLVFATLSLDTPSFEEFFSGLEELVNKVDFTKLPHRRSLSYEGRFNWKTMYSPLFIDLLCCSLGSTLHLLRDEDTRKETE
jgi:hypothetical protein